MHRDSRPFNKAVNDLLRQPKGTASRTILNENNK